MINIRLVKLMQKHSLMCFPLDRSELSGGTQAADVRVSDPQLADAQVASMSFNNKLIVKLTT